MNATTPIASTEIPRARVSERGQIAPMSLLAGSQPQQAGLFEQLLSFSAPPLHEPAPPPPAPSSSATNEQPSQSDRSDPPAEQVEAPRQDEEDRDDEQLEAAATTTAAAATLANDPAHPNPDNTLAANQPSAESEEDTEPSVDATLSTAATNQQSDADPESADPRLEQLSVTDERAEAAGETQQEVELLTKANAAQESTSSDKATAATAASEIKQVVESNVNAPVATGEQAGQGEKADDINGNSVDQASIQAVDTTDTDQERETNRRGERSGRSQRTKWYEREARGNERAGEGRGTENKSAMAEQTYPPIAVDAASLGNAPSGDTSQQPAGSLALDAELSVAGSETPLFIEPLLASLPADVQASHIALKGSTNLGSGEVGGVTATGQPPQADGSQPQAGSEHRGEQLSRTATAEPNSAKLNQQETVRLIQRVARSFNRLGPMGGEVNLRLHPPELGSLNVQVRLEGRSMTAKLTAETGAAREVILENLPVLKSRLAEQGIEVALFQVDVADNGNADAGLGRGNQQAFEQQGERQPTHYQPPVHRFVSPASNAESDLGDQAVTLRGNSAYGIDVHA